MTSVVGDAEGRAAEQAGEQAGEQAIPGTAGLVDPAVADRRLYRQVAADLRWAFQPPWNWMAGVGINLVLAAVWLIFDPLHAGAHRSWAILIGTYFAVWVLADVTTTNVLGADARRVAARLHHQIPLRRILLIKNLTLLVVVGVPTLIATAAITLATQRSFAVIFTLMGVLFPILTWLGVGNLVSVALPVAALPLKQRWKNRRDLRRTFRWLLALALPYVIYLAVSPLSALPRVIDSRLMLHIPGLPLRAVTTAVTGLVLWVLFSIIALQLSRYRTVQFDDLPEVWSDEPLLRTVRKIHLDVRTILRLRRERKAPDTD